MQIYCDDIGAITVSGSIVRLDLMVQAAGEQNPGGKPKLVLQQQVIMSIDAFLRAATRMQGIIQDFEKRGVIKRAETVDSKGVVTGKIGSAGESLA
jgi:hypothetical protein